MQHQVDATFEKLVSCDKELENHFRQYLHQAYHGDPSKRLDYIDMSEIAWYIVEKIKVEPNKSFASLFNLVEEMLVGADIQIENLLVIGLFESIQNISASYFDYHVYFDKWLKPNSKMKWDNLIDSWEGVDWRNNLSRTN